MKSIIELAREAGFHKWYTQPKEHPDHVAIVARFAHLVRAQALEEAIDLVAFHGGSVEIEAAIRALKTGETK
jgi:hypothetical protein